MLNDVLSLGQANMGQVAPISVYTSGKGSSAAGLTASVQRDTATVSEAPDPGISR